MFDIPKIVTFGPFSGWVLTETLHLICRKFQTAFSDLSTQMRCPRCCRLGKPAIPDLCADFLTNLLVAILIMYGMFSPITLIMLQLADLFISKRSMVGSDEGYAFQTFCEVMCLRWYSTHLCGISL